MLKAIIQNKYKLIAAILLLLLGADAWQHKGQLRVLLPNSFADTAISPAEPKEKRLLVNSGKKWKKAVNTVELVKALDAATPGMECDVYFDTARRIFDVHHDADKSTGLSLQTLLEACKARQLDISIWLDFKNCDASNNRPALTVLQTLQKQYKLDNKIIVESWNTEALALFADSGFYTCYNVPLFNPYSLSRDSLRQLGISISKKLAGSNISALSGYYFQYPFFKANFPGYAVLTWSPPRNSISLVNWLFRRKISRDPSIFINLQ